jgi:hypothetical protein
MRVRLECFAFALATRQQFGIWAAMLIPVDVASLR